MKHLILNIDDINRLSADSIVNTPIVDHNFVEWQKWNRARIDFEEIGFSLNVYAVLSESGHFEHWCAYLRTDNGSIEVGLPKTYNGEKWYFTTKLPVIGAEYTEKPPQNVGVLTAPKVQKWVDYLHRKSLWYMEKVNERDAKVAAFIQKLNAAGITARLLPYNRSRMVWDAVKDGVSYSGEIDLQTGAIKEEVELAYRLRNLDGFLKLTK